MSVLFYGLGFFLAAFLFHILIWRARPPKNHAAALLYIFAVVFAFSILLFKANPGAALSGIAVPQGIYQYLRYCLLFISLSCAYIASYPAIEAESPSIAMILSVAAARQQGLDINIFKNKINNDTLIKPRIEDLLRAKLIYLEGNKYKLSSAGLTVARLFTFFRGILGLKGMGG
ncbi:MAG: hypothetical protein PHR44_07640 [Candidatus Omnitrophica bacterium]|nr:hypothetical protein [Candidatus Omnitrophota bacterium]